MPKPLPLALRALRFFYRFLSPVLPALGVRLLWQTFRPRRRLLRAEQAQFMAGAAPFSFSSTGALTGQTIRLQGYRWGSGPRTVLLVHGWEGSPADFRELVPALLRQGYAVAAFDQPAHGHSEGAETNLVEMKQALVDYTLSVGPPYAVVAHSLGGTAAALFLRDAAAPVEKFTFVASPLSARDTFEVVFTPLQVPQAVRSRFYERLARHLRQPVEHIAFAPAAQLSAHRVLGVYDATDEQVVFERVQQYLTANAVIEPLVVRGVGHTRLLRHAPVVQRIVNFIDA
ncbi:alpha/beta hydrolase [Hymenobacter chitinivorans]|uniref:Alpha/beta hydrolase family protein n=1 Tax=Hymenobacter chitinivorans DSM 11115 TaxID=1121954 RepID=A0A2M9BNK5_9BACT|nr:alpha/beta fold hydrolase [Hymenobacter chitinivorans]PJJ59480.1 alpha/beta hydrolase family protein [Hymenobacter chitinivorans DSM 11115]